MLFFFVTCFSFILFYRYSLPIKPLPPWACEMRLLSFYFWKDLSILFPSAKSLKKTLSVSLNSEIMSAKSNRKSIAPSTSTEENSDAANAVGQEQQVSVLDLPELALECILERLQPDGLCSMACVCTYLRDLCMSDHLWEEHMKQRWGRVIGSAAYREWQGHIVFRKESSNYFFDGGKGRGFLMGYLSKLWPVVFVRSSFNSNHSYGSNTDSNKMKISSKSPDDSVVSCYRALETGKFWFPAQVFNRENGHVGFMLSCYDAELSYDSHTDTFQARYPPHGRRAVAIESGITWDRLRAAPVDTSPHNLHISDCLNDLRPSDHIEIQWRRNKQFPYGWWYGVVGHLETCDGDDSYCRCHESETVVLEFNQYAPGSRWRLTMINRKDHREEGNEANGFYGGIRKLYRKEEISMWQQFWPAEILE